MSSDGTPCCEELLQRIYDDLMRQSSIYRTVGDTYSAAAFERAATMVRDAR